MNEEIFKRFTTHSNSHTGHLFRTNLKFDLAWIVYEETITIGAEVEWDAFICLFGSSASILVPNVDMLAYK